MSKTKTNHSESPTYKELLTEVELLKGKLSQLQKKTAISNSTKHSLDNDLLYSLIQSLPLNIYAKSTTGHFIFANNFYCENINKKPSEILHKTDHDIHPGKHAEKYLADDLQVMSTRSTMSFEEEWKSIGGETKYVHVLKSPIYDPEDSKQPKAVLGTLGIFWDITERKVAELNLQKSEEKHRSIIENIEEGYLEINLAFQILFLNSSLEVITGLKQEKMLHANLLTFFDQASRTKIQKAISRMQKGGEAEFLSNLQMQINNHGTIYLDISFSSITDEFGHINGTRCIIRDISERIKAEKAQRDLQHQLIQSQKMESLGTLAGGIAHDFNNILFLICGYTDLALLDTQEQLDPSLKLHKIKDASNRAKDLVSQILTFARKSEQEYQIVHFTEIAEEVTQFLKSTLPPSISIETYLQDSQTSFVFGNKTEIHQVLMNLGLNAGQAIGKKNGKITFRSTPIDSEQITGLPPSQLTARKHLHFSISDTGIGMPQDILDRIFEPFFTTKEMGKGTGLGLSLAHGIITGMGGTISVYSEIDKGTVFDIYLPLCEETQYSSKKISDKLLSGNKEKILLVDDDPDIRILYATILEELNFNFDTAIDGNEALALFSQPGNNYDCILTDQTMPGMTGVELSKKILAIKPKQKIIICTGYGNNLQKEDLLKAGVSALLAKPIKIAKLSQTLNNVLNKS